MGPSPALDTLRRFLDDAGRGPVENLDGLVDHLGPAWVHLNHRDTSMTIGKLVRIEDPEWSPPLLTFAVERHGGTQFGSTRATLQRWIVDLDAMTVSVDERRFRQVRPRAPKLDVGPIADGLARHIIERMDDERLAWSADRRQVRVLINVVIPATFRETTVKRRKRLRSALDARLEPAGWTPRPGAWRYELHE
jgi:hypothetical protein